MESPSDLSDNTTERVSLILYCSAKFTNRAHPIPLLYIADIVANVYVKNISMSNAQNGARIKIFGGSNDTQSVSGGGSGYVKNVTFEDFVNNSECPLVQLSRDDGLMQFAGRPRRRQPNLSHVVLLDANRSV
jgi:hypothetical protein